MRKALAAILLLSACAGPKPCTRTLCVEKLDGTMELRGWNGTVRVSADTPKPPVPSDSEVTIVNGSADFINRNVKISAAEGSVFRFVVSTTATSIDVSAGMVSISVSSAAPVMIQPGAPYDLPR
jgi:hypothetical protein